MDTRVIRLQADIVELLPALRTFARRFYFSKTDIDDLTQETVTRACRTSTNSTMART